MRRQIMRFTLTTFVLLSVILLSGACSNKVAITAEQFSEVAEDAGLTALDFDNDFDNDTQGLMESRSYALQDFEVHYFVLDSFDKATLFIDEIVASLEQHKTDADSRELFIFSGKSQSSRIITKERYYCVSRIEETVIWGECNIENIDKMKSFFRSIGY